jgi:mannose-6-phosphate isomerase-like protein (cupin superfamily)
MMTIGEKTQTLIKQAGYKKPSVFYKAMRTLYEENTINLKTFYNLLHDRIPPRERTLFQVAALLKITTTELRKGTDQELKPDLDEKKVYSGKHTYNDRAHLYGYHVKAPFMPLKLHLKAGGQTPEDYDSPAAKESQKLVWMIVGKMIVVIKTEAGEERRELHNGQMTSFDARQKHYFINGSKTNSVAHIIHYPAENNALYLP